MNKIVKLLLLSRSRGDTEIFFGRLTAQPSAARKILYNNFISALKESGVWFKLDFIHLLAAENANAALTNLKLLPGYALAANGAPIFTIDRGYLGVIATSSALLTSGYNPNTSVKQYKLNDAILGGWVRTAPTAGIVLYGSTTARMQLQNVTTYFHQINDASALGSYVPAAMTGHFSIRRNNANDSEILRNGISPQIRAAVSTSLPTALSGLSGGIVYSDAELSAMYAGAYLNNTELAALHSALQTYMTAVGA